VVYETGFSIDGRNEAILGVCLSGDNRVYCRLEDDTLVAVDKSRRIIKEYNWIPGLIIAGCDFRGVVADKHVRENLKEHGGIVWFGRHLLRRRLGKETIIFTQKTNEEILRRS